MRRAGPIVIVYKEYLPYEAGCRGSVLSFRVWTAALGTGGVSNPSIASPVTSEHCCEFTSYRSTRPVDIPYSGASVTDLVNICFSLVVDTVSDSSESLQPATSRVSFKGHLRSWYKVVSQHSSRRSKSPC